MGWVERVSVLLGKGEALAFVESHDEDTGFRCYHGHLRKGFGSGCEVGWVNGRRATGTQSGGIFLPIALSFVGVAVPEGPPGLLASLSVIVEDREKFPRWVSFSSAETTPVSMSQKRWPGEESDGPPSWAAVLPSAPGGSTQEERRGAGEGWRATTYSW